MKLFEYQAKNLFANAGIPVPRSMLLDAVDDLDAALALTGFPCVIKSQVLSGGRAKAGLIRFAADRMEAVSSISHLMDHAGIAEVLVEQAVAAEKEFFLSISFDPESGRALIMASAEGGIEIEELAAHSPEKIRREFVDLDEGLHPFQVNDFVWKLGLRGDAFKKMGRIVRALYDVFVQNDAELVEINPLFLTEQGDVVAGDGKVIIDDNSLFRQQANPIERRQYDSDAAYEAALEGIPFLTFGGDIGLMCAGAGLTNTVFDMINYEGGTVAGYVEFGGPNYHKAEKAMSLCLSTDPKVILIITFGTIARADTMARGVVNAIESLQPACQIITCLRGTGEEEARQILQSIGLISLSDTEDAVRTVVAICRGETK